MKFCEVLAGFDRFPFYQIEQADFLMVASTRLIGGASGIFSLHGCWIPEVGVAYLLG